MGILEIMEADPTPRTAIERLFVLPNLGLLSLKTHYSDFLDRHTDKRDPSYKTRCFYRVVPSHANQDDDFGYRSAVRFLPSRNLNISYQERFDVRHCHMNAFAKYLFEREIAVQELFRN